VSRVVAEARGAIERTPDGRSVQRRFRGWPAEDFSAFPTHAYAGAGRAAPVARVQPPAGRSGDAARGELLWRQAPCVNCHALPGGAPGDARWAGDLGPPLGDYGVRRTDIAYTYQVVFDARALNPASVMPPWGAAGLLAPEDVLDLAAFLHSLKSAPVTAVQPAQHPARRDPPAYYFGDNLDPTRNPAALLAERAEALWTRRGAKQASCATCHGADLEQAMAGKATRFPRYIERYGRVVSLEDFLSAHGQETAGVDLPVEGADNLHLAMLVKMQSGGQPLDLDLDDPRTRQAWERGRTTFHKRIGQRNHACADCHSPEQARGRWLGGRYLGRADVSLGLTRTYPAWRTSFGEVWGLRRRIQWCMLPHGANNLAADAVEYADLELYMASFDQGKPMNAPGLKD
jgi:sulfur-oxidizing protein SoxA